MRTLIACLLLAAALPASAQIYKYTDANGNTVFTNEPPDGAKTEVIELPKTNTVEMQTPKAPISDDSTEAPAEAQASYQVLELTGIPDEAALRANNGTFSVGVNIQPRLSPAHRLQLVLDGQPYGEPSNVPRLQLNNIDRGEHSLAVQVISATNTVQQSETSFFTVQRVNTNNSPAFVPKPKPKPAP
ncbi:DUF4124 domain-containing protein [Pseudomonas sp. M30-35]|uniref:DUF4124 domain-containing protein n=1 Tax=Pseudomonas sp. M30-35 TaxID=1981174 RepID=UPI000B3CC66A|nr:DUF4124 domain-containing protein [Pseudomonas sp. M30-35]ARU90170.1 DUF4124 domain-containing protein [Pseudomonas sp. M30-35]